MTPIIIKVLEIADVLLLDNENTIILERHRIAKQIVLPLRWKFMFLVL